MTRHILIFLGTFVVGALIALLARAALFDPALAAGEVAPATSAAGDAANGSASGHATAAAAAPSPAKGKPVNTVCAICGMDVDPSLPTAEFQGKTIGFGCRMCPPKFKADPARYGPYYLRNEVVKK